MCLSFEYFIKRKNNGGTVYNDPIRASPKIKIMTEYNIRKDKEDIRANRKVYKS